MADIDEALALRAAGIEAPLLAWLHGPEIDLSAALAAEIDLGVSSLTQLEQVAEHGRGRVHLKIDTGLSRNGCAPEDWIALVTRAADLEAAQQVQSGLSIQGPAAPTPPPAPASASSARKARPCG